MAVEVKPGSVWAANHPLDKGRTIQVDWVHEGHAYCTTLSNTDAAQAELDSGSHWSRDMRGKSTRVSLKSFRTGAARSGYSLVEGTDAGI